MRLIVHHQLRRVLNTYHLDVGTALTVRVVVSHSIRRDEYLNDLGRMKSEILVEISHKPEV
jgi:hypothetical protein